MLSDENRPAIQSVEKVKHGQFIKPINDELDSKQNKEVYLNKVTDFLSDNRTFTLNESIKINRLLNHPFIDEFWESRGYHRDLLKLVLVFMFCNQIKITKESLVTNFWDMMQNQTDIKWRQSLPQLCEKIKKIEKDLSQKLEQERTKSLTCIICIKNVVSIVYIPCGHFITCVNCHKPSNEQCEKCQTHIEEHVTVYM